MFENIPAEQIKYIFENTDDAVCVVSSSGVLLECNPSAEKLFGIPAESELKIWDAIPYIEGNDDLIQLFIDAVAQKLTSQEAVVDYVKEDGTVHNLHVRLTFFREQLTAYLIVITDLTKLIQVKSAFARYTSPDIADYVLTTAEGQKSGGQTRNVTIMMSDLRGFTALATTMTAQRLISLLNHYFEKMVSVIEKYHGTVIEFLGDGIFVVFGAPKDVPDHADCAVRCAIEMQNAMISVNEWNRENGYPVLEMGIGINSGNVVVGNIGSDKKMKYGCMGSPVNTAGRLESLTVGGQILITANTEKLLGGKLRFVSEGSFLPKGSAYELSFFEVTGIDDLSLELHHEDIVWLDDDEECTVFLLKDKTVIEEEHQGRIFRHSADKRYAMLSVDIELKDHQNILVCRNGERKYAKVTAHGPDGCSICFTSVTQGQ
ncbi:MAG: PAS domain S-box protein [Lachnospiraceae bacterium]|nr:PAS domain S-box protein [Lachnospiraceae bacterium]